jgi:hypothetical protein
MLYAVFDRFIIARFKMKILHELKGAPVAPIEVSVFYQIDRPTHDLIFTVVCHYEQ